MEILLWLVPAGVTTAAAMLWVSWVGRERPDRQPTDADQERFAAAILRPMPTTSGRPRPRPTERSTGVAVRPSARPAENRRSA